MNASGAPASHTPARIASLEKNPDMGQIPDRARVPIRNKSAVRRIGLHRRPMRKMSFVPRAWIRAPAARNSKALKNACVTRWKNAAPAAPAPTAAIMNPSWLTVE
jgi:hypothetical protein